VKILALIGIIFVIAVLAIGAFCVFFDQARLLRAGTTFRFKTNYKKVVLTFDDGPSPIWTPLILDELKKAGVKATFFMIGHHVKMYPDIARRVADEGHTIANHGYAHSVILYYTKAEIEEEIKYTEYVIRETTGQTTRFFRPPKAWSSQKMKQYIKSLGYDIVLWSLNSKDWVSFNHKMMVGYLTRYVQPGDILLFHDSGNVFSQEGGNRRQTVKSIGLLVKTLREKDFEIVSLEELMNEQQRV